MISVGPQSLEMQPAQLHPDYELIEQYCCRAGGKRAQAKSEGGRESARIWQRFYVRSQNWLTFKMRGF